MNKKYIILIIVLISFFTFFYNWAVIRSTIGRYIGPETKIMIKELILGKEGVYQFERLSVYSKMNYNQQVLPKTQFANMHLKEILLDDLKDIAIRFYIEQFNDDLIIVDGEGKIFFINKQFIANSENFNWVQVNSNLLSQSITINNKQYSIKDVLIINNEIYVSYAAYASETGKCQTINISKAKISKKELNFEFFFKSKECKPREFIAGRMISYNHNGKEGLLLTTNAEHTEKERAQDDNSSFGKILFIDLETSNYIIFSKGHRNPQGLTIEKNFILSTEHGPKGGDEINLIQFGKNYGWPIASYGEPYFWQEKSSKVPVYLKNHSDHGFIEPIYSFVTSIGINQIIKVPDNFSEYWKNSFLVTSLNGKTIYRILFDKNFSKVIYNEKIFIGKKMRDIAYSEEFNVFLIAFEKIRDHKTPSIGILSNSFDPLD